MLVTTTPIDRLLYVGKRGMNKEGQWRLAPAYDLCYSYSPSSKWTSRHQLSLAGKQDDFTKNDLLSVAEKMSIKNAKSIVSQITNVVSQWKNYAQTTGVKPEHIEQIENTLRLKL